MKKILFVFLVIVLAACNNGIELNPDYNNAAIQDGKVDQAGGKKHTSAKTETLELTDYSGKVHIKGFYATSDGLLQKTNAYVSVDPDYVLVGGAAWVTETEAGAFLTSSHPDNDLTTWIADAKDQYYADAHKLNVVALGMKIDGVPAATLRNYIQLFQYSTTNSSSAPEGEITIPSNYTLLGGGSQTVYAAGGAGSFITKSYPEGLKWKSQSKDHIYSCPATIISYAIGIQNTAIPGFGVLEAIQSFNDPGETALSGRSAIWAGPPSGYVVSGPGAWASWTSGGRMLMGIQADPIAVTSSAAVSKDHRYADRGTTKAYNVGVRLKP